MTYSICYIGIHSPIRENRPFLKKHPSYEELERIQPLLEHKEFAVHLTDVARLAITEIKGKKSLSLAEYFKLYANKIK